MTLRDVNHLGLLQFGKLVRVPDIRQVEHSECGLACLVAISAAHGRHWSMLDIRQRFGSSGGLNLDQLTEIAHALDMTSRALRLEIDEVDRLTLPCILHWDFDHFVVLTRVAGSEVYVQDPAIGPKVLSRQELARHFTGVALEVGPGHGFVRKKSPPPISLTQISGKIRGTSRAFTQICLLALFLEVLALLAPQFMEVVVDQVISDNDSGLLFVVMIAATIVLALQVAIGGARAWLINWISAHFNQAWYGNIFSRLLDLPAGYFQRRSLGDVISRFGSINAIQQVISVQLITAIMDGLIGMATLIVLFIYSPQITCILIGFVIVYLIIRLAYFRSLQSANLSQIAANARQQSLLVESVRGIQTIQLMSRTGTHISRFMNSVASSLNTGTAIQRLNIAFGAIAGLTTGGQRIVVLGIGAWLALDGKFSAGMLIAYMAYADQFSGRAANLVDYLIQLRLLRTQTDRLADIVLADRERFLVGNYVGPEPKPSVRFSDVSFRYGQDQPWVIRHCSFEISPGESVAICGNSGSGKSTLMKLLLGLIDPEIGSITIGDVDIRNLGKVHYRKMLASVLQDDQLFAGSISENISFFDADADVSLIEKSAQIADIDEDIKLFPMGYATIISDLGSSLSGGQKQRVMIARALYKSPRILLLDEATSHLDRHSESRINQAIAGLSCTRIIIAHREETLRASERILVLRNGKIENPS